MANLTWIGDGELLACDTGPGNALLDDFLAERTGTPIDLDGQQALRGTVHPAILETLLKNPFFAAPPPKSLDREHFAGALQAVSGLSTEDGAATLAAFTAGAIARTPLPAPPARVLVTGGGGRKNPAIMQALAAALGMPARPVENAGWDGDALEAQCFAYLAVRVLRGLPLSLPGTHRRALARCRGGGSCVPERAADQLTLREETQHLGRGIRAARFGVTAVAAAAGPGMAGAVDGPLLQKRFAVRR